MHVSRRCKCDLLQLLTLYFIFSSATRSAHTSGCYEAMGGYLRGKMGALGGVAAVVAVLQISLISAATVLIKKWSRPSHCYPCY